MINLNKRLKQNLFRPHWPVIDLLAQIYQTWQALFFLTVYFTSLIQATSTDFIDIFLWIKFIKKYQQNSIFYQLGHKKSTKNNWCFFKKS